MTIPTPSSSVGNSSSNSSCDISSLEMSAKRAECQKQADLVIKYRSRHLASDIIFISFLGTRPTVKSLLAIRQQTAIYWLSLVAIVSIYVYGYFAYKRYCIRGMKIFGAVKLMLSPFFIWYYRLIGESGLSGWYKVFCVILMLLFLMGSIFAFGFASMSTKLLESIEVTKKDDQKRK